MPKISNNDFFKALYRYDERIRYYDVVQWKVLSIFGLTNKQLAKFKQKKHYLKCSKKTHQMLMVCLTAEKHQIPILLKMIKARHENTQ